MFKSGGPVVQNSLSYGWGSRDFSVRTLSIKYLLEGAPWNRSLTDTSFLRLYWAFGVWRCCVDGISVSAGCLIRLLCPQLNTKMQIYKEEMVVRLPLRLASFLFIRKRKRRRNVLQPW